MITPLEQNEAPEETFTTAINFDQIFEKNVYSSSDKKTGIICTLGPSSWEVETLIKLIDEGMNVARLNFSHGSHEIHY